MPHFSDLYFKDEIEEDEIFTKDLQNMVFSLKKPNQPSFFFGIDCNIEGKSRNWKRIIRF